MSYFEKINGKKGFFFRSENTNKVFHQQCNKNEHWASSVKVLGVNPELLEGIPKERKGSKGPLILAFL